MSTIHSTNPAVLTLGKRSAFEGVARRQGRRRNPARTTPRSSLRTPTNPPRDHAQRGVEKCGRSITNSETPHPDPSLSPTPTKSETPLAQLWQELILGRRAPRAARRESMPPEPASSAPNPRVLRMIEFAVRRVCSERALRCPAEAPLCSRLSAPSRSSGPQRSCAGDGSRPLRRGHVVADLRRSRHPTTGGSAASRAVQWTPWASRALRQDADGGRSVGSDDAVS